MSGWHLVLVCCLVTGAKSEMVKSKLPNAMLGKIWKLADVDMDGKLDMDEFALAMHLIDIKLDGHELPALLPSHLVPPSKMQNGNWGQSVWTGHAITSTSTFRGAGGWGDTFWPGQTERGFVCTRIDYIDGRTPQWMTQEDQEHPDTYFGNTLLIVRLDFFIVDDDWWTFIYSQIDFLLDPNIHIVYIGERMVFTRVGLYWA